MQYIEKGKAEGAQLVLGGERIGSRGFYVQPTIFADCHDDMSIVQVQLRWRFWLAACKLGLL